MNEAMRTANERARSRAMDLLQPDKKALERGLELHRDAVVVDAFGFAPHPFTRRMIEDLNARNESGATAEHLKDRMKEWRFTLMAWDEEAREQYAEAWDASGVTATMQTCGGALPFDKLIRHLSRFFVVWDRQPDLVQKATTPEDAIQAKKEGRRCQFVSLNGLPGDHIAIGPDAGLDMVDHCYNLGCRMMHLTYNLRNLIGDGCIEPADGGLSNWGREVVERMNQAGILVDVPHSGRQTTLDAAEASSAPVAASHTACEALYPHDRCKSDEEIKAIAATGGFVGICVISWFLAEHGTIVDLLDHIDHAVGLVGPDHVAIGTDCACSADPPEGLDLKPFPRPASRDRNWRPEQKQRPMEVSLEPRTGSLRWTNWPLFTVGLAQRGYADEDIRKIIGGNVLRVLGEVAERAGR